MIDAYLDELVARLHAELGGEFVGAWLFGSAALGDFDPTRSDLDVQAVAAHRVPLAVRRRLAAALAHEVLPCPVRGLEFVLYAREDLADPAGPAFQLNLNTGPRMARHVACDPGEDPRFWFVLDVAIGREHARPLAGPPAAEVFPALPRPLIVAALHAALDWYADHAGSTAELILAACRAWAWTETGRWLAKGDAARWAASRLPDPAPVETALAARDDPRAAPTPADAAAVLAAATVGHRVAGRPRQ